MTIFIDVIQDLSIFLLGDGNNITDMAKRYSDIVFALSVI